MVGYCWSVYTKAGNGKSTIEGTFYHFQKRNRIRHTDIEEMRESVREETGLPKASIVSMIPLGRMTKARFDALREDNE